MPRLKYLFVFLVFVSSLNAQWFYFGRNKVQYYDFQWKILQTQHFNIYYYPEMEKIAEIGAKYAEESYELLETKFDFTVHKRIPLIFYATHQHFQQTNITPGFIPEGVGGFFEFIKGRVVIPANGDLNQFKKVIQHELVHVFMFFKIYFENKEHKRAQPTFPPLWFTEGLAEFWSTEWNSQAEMILKDAVLHNYLVPLKEMYRIQGTYMMYKEGEAICRFIKERYGEEKVYQLMDEIWKYDNFQDVFIEILGVDYAAFDREWIYYLKKKYYPQIENNDLSYFIDPTIVKKGFNFKPVFYKDGNNPSVIFYTNRTGYAEIVKAPVKNLNFKEEEKITRLIQGEKNEKFEAFHLFSSGIDICRQHKMVFSVKSSHSDKLYIYNLQKNKIIDEKRWEGIISIQSPSISEDGLRIVFNGISFGGQSDLYLWDVKTDNLSKLTDDVFLDDQPDISPDGNWVAFVSDRTEYGKDWAHDLYILNINTGKIIKLTSYHHKISSPKWFPDGNKLAYIADHKLQYNIWTVELPNQWEESTFALQELNYYKLTSFLNGIWDITITDNGKIIYSVFENSSFQFRIMKPEFTIDNMIPHRQTYAKKVTGEKEKRWHPLLATKTIDVKKIKYSSKFQLDFAQTQVAQDPFWGTMGGGYLSLSDLLSNQYINVMIYQDPRLYGNFLKSLSGAASYVNIGKRINYAFSAYRLAGRFYNHKDGYFYEDRTGVSFAFSYPLSHFSRIDWSTNFDYSDKTIWAIDQRYAVRHSQYIGFINDNTIYYVTGPIDGHRFNFTIGHTMDVKFNNVLYYTLLVDYRHYLRLTTASALAVRVMFLGNEGKETRWYYLGGSWDLRGYRLWSLRGDKIFLVSTELRYPFLDLLYFKLPFLGIGFPRIRGAVFCDAGNAWNNDLEDIKGSIGIGWRVNLGGFLVLRYDIGKRTDFRELDNSLFTQFFFGWDF